MCVRVETDSYNGWCHCHQNRRLCSRSHSHESVIFLVFRAFILLRYGHFVEYIWICMQLIDAAVVVGRIGLCTHGITTQVMLGVSLRARHDTTQVMLGVSLRPRWDTTLVCSNHATTSKMTHSLPRVLASDYQSVQAIRASMCGSMCIDKPLSPRCIYSTG